MAAITKNRRPSWLEIGITGHNFGRGSFQQILVEIGSVVSKEKIFKNFIPPFSNLHNRSK
jgi:hypothetical protein